MLRGSLVHALGLALVATLAAGCDKIPLLAPGESTVTLTSTAVVLPTGGTAEVTAFVAEKSGTPVQNGTGVRFSANLGRLDPVEADTRNGIAVSMFHAGDTAGIADVRATSGGIGGTGETPVNLVKITVGAAAVKFVALRANPSTVPYTGGSADLTATVTAENGRAVTGVPVTFAASNGQLASGRVVTDEFGEARTVLTLTTTSTTRPSASLTATAGAITSAAVTVGWQDAPPPPPNVTIAASPDSVPFNDGQRFTFTATVGPAAAAATAVRYEWTFGDGSTVTTNGNVTAHIYTTKGRQSVKVRVTLANGQAIEAVTEINVAFTSTP